MTSYCRRFTTYWNRLLWGKGTCSRARWGPVHQTTKSPTLDEFKEQFFFRRCSFFSLMENRYGKENHFSTRGTMPPYAFIASLRDRKHLPLRRPHPDGSPEWSGFLRTARIPRFLDSE